jgi:hypothetical protein
VKERENVRKKQSKMEEDGCLEKGGKLRQKKWRKVEG